MPEVVQAVYLVKVKGEAVGVVVDPGRSEDLAQNHGALPDEVEFVSLPVLGASGLAILPIMKAGL